MAFVGLQAVEVPFEYQKCDKNLSKVRVLTDFCYNFASISFMNVSFEDIKCDKNVSKCRFCHNFAIFLV